MSVLFRHLTVFLIIFGLLIDPAIGQAFGNQADRPLGFAICASPFFKQQALSSPPRWIAFFRWRSLKGRHNALAQTRTPPVPVSITLTHFKEAVGLPLGLFLGSPWGQLYDATWQGVDAVQKAFKDTQIAYLITLYPQVRFLASNLSALQYFIVTQIAPELETKFFFSGPIIDFIKNVTFYFDLPEADIRDIVHIFIRKNYVKPMVQRHKRGFYKGGGRALDLPPKDLVDLEKEIMEWTLPLQNVLVQFLSRPTLDPDIFIGQLRYAFESLIKAHAQYNKRVWHGTLSGYAFTPFALVPHDAPRLGHLFQSAA